jgi:SAM-dependent methyltransferase
MTMVLPPVKLRRCGREFLSDDQFYEDSCKQEADRVIGMAGNHCRVLDFGCGAGRLAAGLQASTFDGSYVGLDVDMSRIDWCRENLAANGFDYVHSNARNARFNAKGSDPNPLPFHDNEFSAIYSYAVFTHFSPAETKHYLHELGRVLEPTGNLFLTAHVEPNVPDFVENPPGYPNTPSGNGTTPLHRARYSREYFESLVPPSLEIQTYSWQSEWNGQSVYHLQGVSG